VSIRTRLVCRLDEGDENVMQATSFALVSTPHARWRPARWAGRVLSGLPVAFLLFDAAIKFVRPAFVTEASARIGFPDQLCVPLGVILSACVALYLVPRTAVLGAVLLTGYLGGAVAIHARIGDPLFSHTLFPIYFGVMLWGGLYLRDARVRAAVRREVQ
jgi:hypothetical protein